MGGIATGARERSGWPRLAPLLACVVVAGVFLVAASWTGPGTTSRAWAAANELLATAPVVLAWVLMAFGFGWPLRRWLGIRGPSAAAAQLGLGVAISLALLNAMATCGALSPAGAWSALVAGGLLGAACLWRDPPPRAPTGRLALAAAPAVGILLLASTSPPGWLWSTEFGGYDALSYHLQLPKEWLLDGRLAPSDHCVYSFLPGFVESAYLQLMALRGATVEAALGAATSCQLLHAAMTLLAAWCAGQAAVAWTRTSRASALDAATLPEHSVASGVTAVIMLATPWTIVVGSLAYNEMAVVLLLASGLAVVAPAAEPDAAPRTWLRRSLAIGIVAGAACGAKLTAAGFAAIPLGILLLWSLPPRRWTPAALLAIGTATLVLAPWFMRNALAVGNPLFPFGTALMGAGTWTPEQARIFAEGHASHLDASGRLARLWSQFFVFGFGGNPAPGEPWQPQWGLTPWLALAAMPALLYRSGNGRDLAGCQAALRLGAVLGIQVIVWLAATHLQSRFLLPAVVPAALLAGLAAGRVGTAPAARSAMGAALLLLALAPVLVFSRERGGMPSEAIGAAGLLEGHGRGGSGIEAIPAHWLNQRLPEGSRVLLIGDARPFWYRGAPAAYSWQTTWDRGPMSAALAEHPNEPAAQRAALRASGFTHLLIDPSMLERWRLRGWNDPALVPEAVRPFTEAPNRVVARFEGGGVLVELAE